MTFRIGFFGIVCLACTGSGNDASPSDSAETAVEDVDTDGDGLLDSEELDLGTDPTQPDSDGDGYSDGDEVVEGSDPLDSESGIYAGGWPYNPDKSQYADGDWAVAPELGVRVPPYVAVDQFGDLVRLHDFGGQGAPVVLDMGTKWCSPCKSMAAYLSTGDVSHVEEWAWWKSDYEGLFEMVQNGELLWLTVLFSNGDAGPSTEEDAAEWDAAYPNEHVPVLADSELMMYTWLDIQSYPALSMLDSEMRLVEYSNTGPYAVLGAIGEMLAE